MREARAAMHEQPLTAGDPFQPKWESLSTYEPPAERPCDHACVLRVVPKD